MQPIGLEGLRRLPELVMGIHRLDGIGETLDAVLEGVRELLGSEVALVDMLQPDGWIECLAVAGGEAHAVPAPGDVRRPCGHRHRDLSCARRPSSSSCVCATFMHPGELDRHSADLERLISKELTHYTRERRWR